MPLMSAVEAAFCRSPPWRWFAGHVVLPWVIGDATLTGDVLEIGGGSGVMAGRTLQSHPDVTLTLVDLDPAMASVARRRLQGTSATVVSGDVLDLPFADGSFDVVSSYLMLHHVIDWPGALREVARVLRPGGRFVGYDLAASRLAEWTHQLDRSPHELIKPEQLRRGIEQVGLRVEDFDTSLRRHVMRFSAQKMRAEPATPG